MFKKKTLQTCSKLIQVGTTLSLVNWPQTRLNSWRTSLNWLINGKLLQVSEKLHFQNTNLFLKTNFYYVVSEIKQKRERERCVFVYNQNYFVFISCVFQGSKVKTLLIMTMLDSLSIYIFSDRNMNTLYSKTQMLKGIC